jgi:hypothetical protein
MSTFTLVALLLVLVVGVGVWARLRSRQIRAQSEQRERAALEAMRAGKDPLADAAAADTPAETVFDAGLPSEFRPGRGGIVVAEMADTVELDQLLADESNAVAERARAQLEEPTNIDLGTLTIPPRPVVPIPAPTPVAPVPAMPAVAARAVAMPPIAVRPPATPLIVRTATAIAPQAQPAAKPAAPARKAAPPSVPGQDVALRELVLAWFEARGYRGAPASPAVRPIELVLRHKDDPARAYAFVVDRQRVDAARVKELAKQARSIGLVRMLVVADGGSSEDAAQAKKGVRVMDRGAIDAEFRRLEVSVAAKIIAVARKRELTRATA